jgi:putative oxidoreductase
MNWAYKLHNDDLAKLLLRLMVGGLMLFHGVAKLQSGVDGIVGLLESKGIPGFMAYGVYIGEVMAPVLLLLGYFTRAAGAIVAVNMVVAVSLVHSKQIFLLDAQSGAPQLELHWFYLLGAIALVFSGGGKYSLSRGSGPLD